MTDNNTYVRYADVERMLDERIGALGKEIVKHSERLTATIASNDTWTLRVRAIAFDLMTVNEQRYGAIKALRDLGTSVPIYKLVPETVNGAVLVDADDNAVTVE